MRCVRSNVTQCMFQEAWKCVDGLWLDTVAYAALSGCSESEWKCAQCRRGSPKSPSFDALIADRLGEVLVAIRRSGIKKSLTQIPIFTNLTFL